tara:strand:- start:428 stop:562 length:135 start_codon:yes stop_codon:yes gene_type:complete
MFKMKIEGRPDRSRQESIKERIRQTTRKNAEKETIQKEHKNANS